MTPEVLHYVGADDDGGGIVSVVRALAGTGRFQCVLGVNPGCEQRRVPPLPVLELPRIAGETISPRTFWRARAVARAVQAWLAARPGRRFHGHSRAGMLVGLWLHRWQVPGVNVSVHCYGRQRWFYRWAARRLGSRLFWLSPAMKIYYGMGGATWTQCIPGAVPRGPVAVAPPPGGMLRLGGIGLLVEWKRWQLVVEALAQLPPALRERISFEHIGAAPADAAGRRYAAGLRELTVRSGLAAQVRWMGAEPSSARLLREIDVLLVASRNEPFSVALMEALAAGVPVLASDSGGAVDIIRPGENGWLFPSDQARGLTEALAGRLNDPAGTRLDRERIRRTAIYADNIAAQWAQVYAASDFDDPTEPRTRFGQLAAGLGANLQFSNWPGILLHRFMRRGAGEFTYVWQDRLRIVCDGGRRDHVALQEIFCRQSYAGWLRGCDFPGRLIRYVNVGAHIGAFDLWLRESGLVIADSLAAELNPETCGRCRRNLAANRLEGVRVVNCGVAGAGGTIDFTPSGDSLSDGIFPDQAPASGGTTRVTLLSLREFIDQEAGGPALFDLLKLDCEGAEYGILRATAPADLRRFRHILIEFHPEPVGESVDAAYRQLRDAGFFSRRGRPGTFRFVDLFTRGPDGS